MARPGDLDLAVALADRADRPSDWYGIGRVNLGSLVLIVVRGDRDYGRMTRGRAPAWGAGFALPAARFILIRADGDDPFRVLRHELAHLALHARVKGRVPLWFDEGYAVIAAGEFGRMAQLGLNLTVARGRVPDLDGLSNGLRGDRSTAEASYALAGAAVSYLAGRTATRDLVPLISRLETGVPFDSAVTLTTGLNPGRFEEAWLRAAKRRYGWGLWFASGGMWLVLGGLVVLAHFLRRRRDQPRREGLNVGWDVPTSDEEGPEAPPTA